MKLIAKLSVLAFAIGSNLLATAASASPQYGYELTFYSDASRTVAVGEETLMCTGSRHTTGQVTPYWIKHVQWDCKNTKGPEAGG